MYQALFSARARRAFQDLPPREAERVKAVIVKLQKDPRSPVTIKSSHAPVAQYRYRLGNYRLLFDLDDEHQIIELLDIHKRNEQTYR